jgi:hypothetical protein
MGIIHEADVNVFPVTMPTTHNELRIPSLLISRDILWTAKNSIEVEISRLVSSHVTTPNIYWTTADIENNSKPSIFQFGRVYALLALLLNVDATDAISCPFQVALGTTFIQRNSGFQSYKKIDSTQRLRGISRLGMHRLS